MKEKRKKTKQTENKQKNKDRKEQGGRSYSEKVRAN